MPRRPRISIISQRKALISTVRAWNSTIPSFLKVLSALISESPTQVSLATTPQPLRSRKSRSTRPFCPTCQTEARKPDCSSLCLAPRRSFLLTKPVRQGSISPLRSSCRSILISRIASARWRFLRIACRWTRSFPFLRWRACNWTTPPIRVGFKSSAADA